MSTKLMDLHPVNNLYGGLIKRPIRLLIAFCLIVPWVALFGLSGCGSRSGAHIDRRLVGTWQIVESEVQGTATFTDGGNLLFVWHHTDSEENRVQTGTYRLEGRKLIIRENDEHDRETVRQVEFLSDDALLVHKPKDLYFAWLYGRLRRVKAFPKELFP